MCIYNYIIGINYILLFVLSIVIKFACVCHHSGKTHILVVVLTSKIKYCSLHWAECFTGAKNVCLLSNETCSFISIVHHGSKF